MAKSIHTERFRVDAFFGYTNLQGCVVVIAYRRQLGSLVHQTVPPFSGFGLRCSGSILAVVAYSTSSREGEDMIWTERTPTLEEYRQLCTAVNWQNVMNFDVAPEALKASLYAVVVHNPEGQIAGMARVVGGWVHLLLLAGCGDPPCLSRARARAGFAGPGDGLDSKTRPRESFCGAVLGTGQRRLLPQIWLREPRRFDWHVHGG